MEEKTYIVSQKGQIPRTKMDPEFLVNMQICTFVDDTNTFKD